MALLFALDHAKKSPFRMSKAVNAIPQRAVVAAVQLPAVSDAELEASLDELRELAKTLGFEVVATFTQRRTSFDSTAYLGTGKREEMRQLMSNVEAAVSVAAGVKLARTSGHQPTRKRNHREPGGVAHGVRPLEGVPSRWSRMA